MNGCLFIIITVRSVILKLYVTYVDLHFRTGFNLGGVAAVVAVQAAIGESVELKTRCEEEEEERSAGQAAGFL